MSHTEHLSIIIPTLDEAKNLPVILNQVMHLALRTSEIIVVDGGSRDNTVEITRQYAVKILQTDKACRALQMNMEPYLLLVIFSALVFMLGINI